MKKQLGLIKGFVTRNKIKIIWLTAWLVTMLVMTSQGLADGLEGPYPPPGG